VLNRLRGRDKKSWTKRKKSKQPKPNPSVVNESSKTGPIRTRAAGKKLTRQRASPYPVRSSPKPKTTIKNAAQSNGVWRHDLFQTVNNPGPSARRPNTANGSSSSITSRLGTGTSSGANLGGVAGRLSIKGAAGNKQSEFTIRGEGGPATIVVQNLAPGTSANDVKTAFMAFGDIVTLNVRNERNPLSPVSADITFESKASALAAINKYNAALADGRVLKVQLKNPVVAPTPAAPSGGFGAASYRLRNKNVRMQSPLTRQNGKLYSDAMVTDNAKNGYGRRIGAVGKGKGKTHMFNVKF
jgi:hypothetical protein